MNQKSGGREALHMAILDVTGPVSAQLETIEAPDQPMLGWTEESAIAVQDGSSNHLKGSSRTNAKARTRAKGKHALRSDFP